MKGLYVGCWDCGIPLKGNSHDRPRFARKDGTGWNNTVDCCKKCKEMWMKKHPEYRRS